HEFINAIIEREANEKWIDRSGKIAEPLITTDEHHELLAMIALEMWLSGSELLRQDVLDVIADVFAEAHAKSPSIARQVKERLRQHALISTADSTRSTFAFDHEDFRRFFLGEAIGNALLNSTKDLQSAIQRGALPAETAESVAQYVRRGAQDVQTIANGILDVARRDHSTSFTRENCAAIVVRLMDGMPGRALSLQSLTFAPDVFRGRFLSELIFERCYFQSTSFERAQLTKCTFRNCRFETIEVYETTKVEECWIDTCEFGSVSNPELDVRVFDPTGKLEYLQTAGFQVVSTVLQTPSAVAALDDRTVLVERALRLFLRNTQVNESQLRLRLGVKANEFVDDILPVLVRVGVLEDVRYSGSGRQRRFRLGVPMQRIEQVFRTSSGDFDTFLEQVANRTAVE
ncbi:MAG TPA: hypothetical protein VII75_13700, partial [Thermoanaerobaculia bacterium]